MLWSVVSGFYFTTRDDLFSTNELTHTHTHTNTNTNTYACAYIYIQGLRHCSEQNLYFILLSLLNERSNSGLKFHAVSLFIGDYFIKWQTYFYEIWL